MCLSFKRVKRRLRANKDRKGGPDIGILDKEMDGDEPTEACIMESEQFRGATATFGESGRIIPASEDLFPTKYGTNIGVLCVANYG